MPLGGHYCSLWLHLSLQFVATLPPSFFGIHDNMKDFVVGKSFDCATMFKSTLHLLLPTLHFLLNWFFLSLFVLHTNFFFFTLVYPFATSSNDNFSFHFYSLLSRVFSLLGFFCFFLLSNSSFKLIAWYINLMETNYQYSCNSN